jgi:DNA-binding NarL/FixJ family response regulator
MKKYRIDVFIADDHTMLNEGLKEAINRSETVYVSRTFTTLAKCKAALLEHHPDVLLLDISMPDGDGTVFCKWVQEKYPKIKILALTIHDEYAVIQRLLDSGVNGYILKSSPIDELLCAIVAVYQGKQYISAEVEEIIRQGSASAVILTSVERNVLQLICEGQANSEIAEHLNLSIETVNWYRKRLLAKYGVKKTVQLVSLVLKEGIL